jgi:hypothetical protein
VTVGAADEEDEGRLRALPQRGPRCSRAARAWSQQGSSKDHWLRSIRRKTMESLAPEKGG